MSTETMKVDGVIYQYKHPSETGFPYFKDCTKDEFDRVSSWGYPTRIVYTNDAVAELIEAVKNLRSIQTSGVWPAARSADIRMAYARLASLKQHATRVDIERAMEVRVDAALARVGGAV
jgi:hypothetical protein